MGSLCCVAAKSDRSDSTSRDFSFGRPHEPYWRTNTSFSPPSSRWGLTDGISFYDGSSTSSNANLLPSPDLSQTLHWTPSDFDSSTRRDQILKQQPGTSDIGDSEPNRNFSNRRFFFPKPVHPLHHHPSGNARETTPDSADACSWSSRTTSSSIDSVDVPEAALDWDNNNSTKPQRVASSSTFRCGLCNRYISQKLPCGSRSIIRNRDMPVTGVLPCQHVFHAECLDQSTPNAHRSDPPCPVCSKQEGEQPKSHNIVMRVKPFCEDGPAARQRGCGQVGDCVGRDVNVPPRSTMMMINRNRMRKSISLRGGNSSKDSPRKVKKSSSFGMENLSNQLSFVRSRGKEKV